MIISGIFTKIQYRIIIDLMILILIFILPWWLSVIMVYLSIFIFKNYFESLVFSLLMDGFLGVEGSPFFGSNSFFTIVVGVILIVSLWLKPRLKFY